jgi:adenylate cyclase
MKEKRQLLAIMFTDIVGYTAMMGESESKALETLKKNRDLHHAFVQEFRGEYLQEIGDGTLASFESAVDAVGCALELQRSVSDHPDLNLRIGIHLGDVIQKEGDIVGDAVNVASRIEPLAATGGICISGNVYESVRNKTGIEGVFVGAKTLKNVSEPVRVYGLTGEGLPPAEEIKAAAERVPSVKAASLSPGAKITMAVLVLAAIAGLWFGVIQRQARVEPASEANMAFPLPDKPSIAVLPFDNMSGDPEQEYFSDGLTEDIITGLAKVPGLFVIARNSSFTYKGRPVKVQQVSEELGVRYVLEGSVRRAGGTVRITTQLIDALTGHHLWAEKYDRNLEDVFAVIDEITKESMTALQVNVTEGEYARIFGKGTKNLEAYENVLRGANHHRAFNKDENLLAMSFFEKAIELDPNYSVAYAFLARTHHRSILLGSSSDRKKSMGQAFALVKKAIELDDTLGWAHSYLGWLLVVTRQYDTGLAEFELGISLAPSSAETVGWHGFALNYIGKRDEAIKTIEKALRLDPFPPPVVFLFLGVAYRDAERYDEAIETCGKIIPMEPDMIFARTCLASAYSLSGQDEKARAEAAEVLRINPKFNLKGVARMPYKNPIDLERMLSSLRNAGLPD